MNEINSTSINNGEPQNMAIVTFTSSNVFNVRENLKTIHAVVATTDGDHALSYAITNGADQDKFDIDANTGLLAFKQAADFENPSDANTDNVYEVTVEANDGNGSSDSQSITVTVTDVDDALEKVEDLAEAIGQDMANVNSSISALETNKADQSALDLANQSINTLITNLSALTTKVDVPTTVSDAIADAISVYDNVLKNGVAAELNTLKELADKIVQNEDLLAALQSINAVRYDVVQAITSSQKKIALFNIGAASNEELQDHIANMGNNSTFDPVSVYNASKTA